MPSWYEYPASTAHGPRPQGSRDTADIEALARRRAGIKLGWLVHATVYVLVNLLLAMIALSQGRSWAVYPALGWGLGLAIHGVVAYLASGGGGWHAGLVDRERERLLRERQGGAR